MENFEKYDTRIAYPERPHRPHLPDKATSGQTREYAKELETWEAAVVQYREAKEVYDADCDRLMERFQDDLLRDLGIIGHVKAKELYALAWYRGHSSGLASVYDKARELVDLIK